jgi:zinc finger protein
MESDIDMPCPICSKSGQLKMISHIDDIPYFGEHTQVTLLCNACGWRQTDFIPAEGKKPVASSLFISGEDELRARVVRSSSCTISIPELELEVSPGTSNSGYVSNIEGVLNRFIQVVEMVLKDLDDPTQVGAATRILLVLYEVKEGRGSGITVELLDPRGHSMVLHENTVNRDLTEEELESLPLGPEPPVIEK